jgi:hypothetical protein
MQNPELPQVLVELRLRGDPPILDAIKFQSGPFADNVAGLQSRDLNKAVASILLLFHAYNDVKFFRIKTDQSNRSLVHTILNAKNQPQGKSSIRGLAKGLFLQLFLKPTTENGRYLDIETERLRSNSLTIFHDGRMIENPHILRNMAAQIAASAGWNIDDYLLEIRYWNQISPVGLQFDSSTSRSIPPDLPDPQPVLDNPALAAIREAIRQFCEDGGDQSLRVGPIRSPAELEDLWAIDNEAYGEASISYEKFNDWWSSFPSGLQALFFRNRVMGAIGIWPLSLRYAGRLTAAKMKESELSGRTMRTFVNAPSHFWYVSGIVLHPKLVGGRAIKILLSRGIESWLSSANIQFPCQLLALAYSEQGQALLEGFSFYRMQHAKIMPDGVPLFALALKSKEYLVSSLRARGLEINLPDAKQA